MGPSRLVPLYLALTIASFAGAMLCWDLVGPHLTPPGRPRALLGFVPIELLGLLLPALFVAALGRLDLRLAAPREAQVWGRVAGATLGLAVVMTYLQEAFTHLTGWTYPPGIRELLRLDSGPEAVLVIVCAALVPAVAEEVSLRGVLQGLLARCGPAGLAIACSTAFFAVLHLTPAGLPTYLALGAWLGWVRHRTGALALCITGHAVNNLLAIAQANWLPDPFWHTHMAWLLPSGLVLFALLGVSLPGDQTA